MSAIIRDSFKVRTLLNFINGLTTDSLYLGIGRPQPWDIVSNLDINVPIPVNTNTDVNADWEDVFALKKVSFTDVYPGIFKEMWQVNVKYDAYRHDWDGTRIAVYNGLNAVPTTPSSLSDVKCFVITANYGIYACLKQSVINGAVQPSLYSPETGVSVGVNTGIVKTADGYYWKYMATTGPSDLVKFSSKYYHPIETLTTAPAEADPYYVQWLNQGYSSSLKGGIYVINVTTNGSGYNGGVAGSHSVLDAETDTQFKVIGNGSGLQLTVTYSSGGSITDIEVTNPGTGYTHATITAVGGNNASFDIVYTPMSGLGADPVRDCVARYLIVDVTLTGAEGSGDFTILNEYRKITLVYNPTNFGTTTIATTSTLDASIKLEVGLGLTLGDYPLDSIVTGQTSGAKGRVVDFNTTTGFLRIIRTSSENDGILGANNSFLVGESIVASPGTGNVAILSRSDPEVQKNSGEIIYSEYRSPIMRSELQTEDLKIIIKF